MLLLWNHNNSKHITVSLYFRRFIQVILAGDVAFYTWPSLGCPSAIGWQEDLVAAVGRPTTAVLRGKGRFAFVGMFPQIIGYHNM
jgi:hypothetical protein